MPENHGDREKRRSAFLEGLSTDELIKIHTRAVRAASAGRFAEPAEIFPHAEFDDWATWMHVLDAELTGRRTRRRA